MKFETKDSGERQEYASGMKRDLQDGKANFSLIIPKDMPYQELLLTRWAELMERGAVKYGQRNWEKAESDEELERFKASAYRHFMQWLSGEEDEDHAAAVLFNINCSEYVKWRQKEEEDEVKTFVRRIKENEKSGDKGYKGIFGDKRG